MSSNESESISRIKAVVADKIFESPYCKEECDFSYFEDEDGGRHYQGVVSLKVDERINIVFSVPVNSRNIFVIASDGNERGIRIAIANIEESDRGTPIKVGNLLTLNSEIMSSKNIFGAIFLSVKTSNVLNYLPDIIEVDDAQYKFLLVVFISHKEHKVWSELGHDALMDYFSETNKDLIRF